MAGITLEQAQAQLDTWLEASTAVANGQDFVLPGNKRMTKVDAAEIRKQVSYWNIMVKRLSGGIPVYGGTPVDA